MRKLVHVLAIAAALVPVTALATTVRVLSTEALATEAEVIAIGRCTSLEAVWEGRVLVTRATVEVSESLKGEVSGTIVVTLPGGTDLNRRIKLAMTYPGAPVMREGERVFLFLDRADAADTLTVAGFAQGKYSIVADPSGAQYVSRDLTNLTLATGRGQTPGARNLRPLADFRQEVRGHLGR